DGATTGGAAEAVTTSSGSTVSGRISGSAAVTAVVGIGGGNPAPRGRLAETGGRVAGTGGRGIGGGGARGGGGCPGGGGEGAGLAGGGGRGTRFWRWAPPASTVSAARPAAPPASSPTPQSETPSRTPDSAASSRP